MLQTLINLARPLLLSVFPQQESLSIEQLNNSLEQLFKYVFSLLITSALLVIISTFLIHRSLNQLDQQVFAFSPSMILLIILLIIDGAALAYLLLKNPPQRPVEKNLNKAPSPLEHAVSAYILDMIDERKQQRQEPKTPESNEPKASI